MARKQLQTLLDDVEQRLAAGSATASDDERLRRHAGTVRDLSRQVPALALLAEALDRAGQAGPTGASRAWLDLIVLTRQVRVALGTEAPEGEVEPVPPSGPWTTDLSPADLLRLAAVLRGGRAGTRDVLELEKAQDLRLWPLIRGSLDTWGEAGDLAALRVLPRLGRPVLAGLERALDLRSRPGGGRRLSALALSDPQAAVRLCLRRFPGETGAFRLLGLLGLPAVALFVRVLANPNGNYANWDLERIANDILTSFAADAVALLRPALRDPDASRRADAARDLACLGRASAAAYPDLVACLRDPAGAVQRAAAEALENLGAPRAEVAAVLMELLDHPDTVVRRAVVVALGKAVSRNRAALAALRAAGKSERNPGVRSAIEAVVGGKRGKK
jgi:hypothetical protein